MGNIAYNDLFVKVGGPTRVQRRMSNTWQARIREVDGKALTMLSKRQCQLLCRLEEKGIFNISDFLFTENSTDERLIECHSLTCACGMSEIQRIDMLNSSGKVKVDLEYYEEWKSQDVRWECQDVRIDHIIFAIRY